MLNYDFEDLKQAYRNNEASRISILSKKLIDKLILTDFLADKLYYHPLGFIYAVIHTYPNNENIRLHIWNKEIYDIKPKLEIHNHYYRINSFVYQGCIFNQLFDQVEFSEGHFTLYEGSYSEDGHRYLTKTNNVVDLVLGNKYVLNKGSLYTIEPDQVHMGGIVQDNTGIAVTLVYTQDPQDNNSPLVFGHSSLPDFLEFKKRLVPKTTLALLYNQLNDA